MNEKFIGCCTVVFGSEKFIVKLWNDYKASSLHNKTQQIGDEVTACCMKMAFASTPFPPPFLPCPGEPPIPLVTWKKMFENYLLVVDATGDKWPQGRKKALLLHSLGTEGQRLFYTLPNPGTTMDDALKALEAHFNPKRNTVAERHAFRKRTQAQNESILQYVAALRDLATTCEFGDKEDEMLRDQLVEHVSSQRIRERLLLETNLTLERAITLATQIEAALMQAKSISAIAAVAPVDAVHTKSTDGKNRPRRPRPKKQPTAANARPTGASTSSRSCYRCGSDQHMANNKTCPAATAKCNNCQKTGHFARVCRSSQTHHVDEVDLPEIQILYLHEAAMPDRIRCTANVKTSSATAPIEFVVDSGSSVSIIPQSLYEAKFSQDTLQPPTANLVTYSRSPIPVLGCLPVLVSRNDASCPTKLFVVGSGTALLGMDLIKGLELCFNGSTIQGEHRPTALAPVMDLSTTPPLPSGYGCAKQFVHKVKVSSAVTPVRQKLRRLPLSVRDAVSKEIDRLLKEGIIEKIDASPWVSPIVVIQKKSGGIRMCVDLREPNKAVVTDSYPLPHIDELLSRLKDATVFSTIDLEAAYFQLPLHEESRDLTAFITHEGLFRFCRVPYGLASAPSAFQKMLATVLEGLPNVANYLDDIILWGKTRAAHDATLASVLQRLQEAGLQLNRDKCQFSKTTLRFLGHTVTPQGIQPTDDHLSAIMNAPPPPDAQTLRSFLGLLSWYNKFIPNFSTVVEPLRACIRQDTEFKWTKEAQCSFETAKQLLVDSPALALFDPDLPTIVSTDASNYGLGAVLTQMHGQTERVVAFASRSLSSAERKYSTIEKEALGCVWAVEKWRTLLWGRKFTLRTDHQALTTLLTSKGTDRAGMRIARWAARLLCFTYDVIYRPGSQNSTADCLSRIPLPAVADGCVDSEPEFVAMLSTTMTAVSPTEFASASAACPELAALRSQIAKSWPRSASILPDTVRPYFRLRDEFSVQNDYVFRGCRLVVPLSLRNTLVNLAHEGHQGIVRTKQRLRDLYWWPRMDEQVNQQVKVCQLCQSCDKTATPAAAPLQPVPFPSQPWEKLAVDIVGPMETAPWDCRYAITLTDYHSKWPEVAFGATITSDNAISFLTSIFSRFGNPNSIVTDNGTQFTSAEFAEFLKSRDIQHIRTSVYHPAANGAIERFHRVLKSCIQSAILEKKPWKSTVSDFLQVYRSTPHSTTGVSPSELLVGRKMRTRLNVLPPVSSSKDTAAVSQRVAAQQSKMKTYTDARRGARSPPFKEGDSVRVRKPTHVPKAHPRFTEPMRIQRKVGPATYRLQDGKKWHASRLAMSNVPARPIQADFDLPTEEPPTVQPTVQPDVPHHHPAPAIEVPARVRRPPRWLQDFVE